MLKLRLEIEDWREIVRGWLVVDHLDEAEIDGLAERLMGDTVDEYLLDAGHDFQRVFTQSRGAFVIVQNGTRAERAAFDVAMQVCIDDLAKELANSSHA